MNRERLEIIAQICDQVNPQKFNMAFFKEETNCGTVACAIGYAAADSRFIEKRFYIESTQCNDFQVYYIDGEGAKHQSFSAIAKFLQIPYPNSLDLFDSCSYGNRRDPKLVARVIRYYIKSNGKTANRHWDDEIDQLEFDLEKKNDNT